MALRADNTHPLEWTALRFVHFSSQILPGWLLWLSTAVLVASLLLAAWRAPWRALREQPARMHLVAGGAVACLLLWLLNIHLVEGLVLHFLGITALTLLVGWSFSVLAASAVMPGLFLLQGLDWSVYPVSVCLTVLLPATVTWLLVQALYRPGLNHPFIYILGAGFFGGGLAIAAVAVASVALFALLGLNEWVSAALAGWPLFFMVMFSECFINGMCVSALAIFYPDWMKTFDDHFYLDDGP